MSTSPIEPRPAVAKPGRLSARSLTVDQSQERLGAMSRRPLRDMSRLQRSGSGSEAESGLFKGTAYL
jgi:predicted DNA-binding transcriptional regulator YafY